MEHSISWRYLQAERRSRGRGVTLFQIDRAPLAWVNRVVGINGDSICFLLYFWCGSGVNSKTFKLTKSKYQNRGVENLVGRWEWGRHREIQLTAGSWHRLYCEFRMWDLGCPDIRIAHSEKVDFEFALCSMRYAPCWTLLTADGRVLAISYFLTRR